MSKESKPEKIDEVKRESPKRLKLTAAVLRSLKRPRKGYTQYWDHGTGAELGLSVMVGPNTMTFRSTFPLHGRYASRKLWRVGRKVSDQMLEDHYYEKYEGQKYERLNAAQREDARLELEVELARAEVRNDRATAEGNKDPRRALVKKSRVYEDVVDRYIDDVAKEQQRSWEQTRHALKHHCTDWLKRPIATITEEDATELLEGLKKSGRERTAQLTLTWLKALWEWAWKKKLVADRDVMARVDLSLKPKRKRPAKVFTDDEIKAIWSAADKLDPVRRDYVKLLVLLAPRKNELTGMRRSELDDIDNPRTWTTPLERTKSKATVEKREYVTPLPPLAQRILKARLRDEKDPELIFPSTVKNVPIDAGSPLKRLLVKNGAPADFNYHAARHTVATWLGQFGNVGPDAKPKGYTEGDISLVLNHAASRGVTGSYMHSIAGEFKLKMLTEWAVHIETLVTPKGVKLLR